MITSLFNTMGRGGGKGKKLTATNHEDLKSDEDEKVSTQKRRGRPQTLLKYGFDEDVVKIEENDNNNINNGFYTKEMKSPNATERKRKQNSQVKEELESIDEENGVGNRSSSEELAKPNGFRHNGSRHKSKPHRAAEAGAIVCNASEILGKL